MTEISFHTGVVEPLGYACRLLRKALSKGSKIAVSAELSTLSQLDLALWRFDPGAFVAHVLLRQGPPPPRLLPTPIWLLPPGVASPVHEVLINLGPDLADGFETYQRVVEIVAGDGVLAEAGRRRFRHYKERGYAIEHHRVAVTG